MESVKPRVYAKNLNFSYGDLLVLQKVSFNVSNGEFVSIVGPSGCGKSTLLHLLYGFLQPSNGFVNSCGKLGFVFQEHNLFPWMTVFDNVAVGPINQNKKQIKRLVGSILKKVGLFEFKDYYPHQLSEGMRQRVGIARCLVNKSDVILMDEPFASLDYFTRLKMQGFLKSLIKKQKITVVLVTHDVDEAIKLSDKIIVLNGSPAKIQKTLVVESGKSEEIKDHILRLMFS